MTAHPEVELELATTPSLATLPLVPKNTLPLWKLVRSVRALDTGQEVIRAAGGSVTRLTFGPKWLMPPLVSVMPPNAIRDVLARNDVFSERCIVHQEVQRLGGNSLFVLPTEQWQPRKRALQPVFTKLNVRTFGGHMARAAQAFVDTWRADGDVDLDVACRALTMRSLGRSVLGMDLNERAEDIAAHMHVASSYTADRALRPVRAPHWLPFAGGARSCIGEHFAMLETTLALATIVRATRLRSRDSDFPVDVPFTTVAKGPVWAHVDPRG